MYFYQSSLFLDMGVCFRLQNRNPTVKAVVQQRNAIVEFLVLIWVGVLVKSGRHHLIILVQKYTTCIPDFHWLPGMLPPHKGNNVDWLPKNPGWSLHLWHMSSEMQIRSFQKAIWQMPSVASQLLWPCTRSGSISQNCNRGRKLFQSRRSLRNPHYKINMWSKIGSSSSHCRNKALAWCLLCTCYQRWCFLMRCLFFIALWTWGRINFTFNATFHFFSIFACKLGKHGILSFYKCIRVFSGLCFPWQWKIAKHNNKVEKQENSGDQDRGPTRPVTPERWNWNK